MVALEVKKQKSSFLIYYWKTSAGWSLALILPGPEHGESLETVFAQSRGFLNVFIRKALAYLSETKPPHTQPTSPPAFQSSNTDADVRTIAKKLIFALWDADINAVKTLSAGSVEGWMKQESPGFASYVAIGLYEPSLQGFSKLLATEIPAIFASKNEITDNRLDVCISGNLALVRLNGPEKEGLALFFRNIQGKWWWIGVGAAPITTSAKQAMAEDGKKFRALVAQVKLLQNKHPATQPTTTPAAQTPSAGVK